MKKRIAVTLLALVLLLCFTASAMAQTVTFGSYGYDPIYWIVLSSDAQHTRLLSEYAIACMPFDEDSSDWDKSDLRDWLNNTFAYSAFTRSERESLCMLNNDLVRIPSLGDITNAQYGFATSQKAEDSSRAAVGSSSAIDQGLWVNSLNLCSYYTLTTVDSESLYQVLSTGAIGIARCDRENVGIRPMIIVLTSALK